LEATGGLRPKLRDSCEALTAATAATARLRKLEKADREFFAKVQPLPDLGGAFAVLGSIGMVARVDQDAV
jgi:hypothetical protein